MATWALIMAALAIATQHAACIEHGVVDTWSCEGACEGQWRVEFDCLALIPGEAP